MIKKHKQTNKQINNNKKQRKLKRPSCLWFSIRYYNKNNVKIKTLVKKQKKNRTEIITK